MISADMHGCSKSAFKCKLGTCISNAKRCDGNSDCEDNSDELNCGKST